MKEATASTVSLYVVQTATGQYFAGFDASKGAAQYATSPINGKKFTNKFDIKLRPDERIVEISVDLGKLISSDAMTISEPFRPQFRKKLS